MLHKLWQGPVASSMLAHCVYSKSKLIHVGKMMTRSPPGGLFLLPQAPTLASPLHVHINQLNTHLNSWYQHKAHCMLSASMQLLYAYSMASPLRRSYKLPVPGPYYTMMFLRTSSPWCSAGIHGCSCYSCSSCCLAVESAVAPRAKDATTALRPG